MRRKMLPGVFLLLTLAVATSIDALAVGLSFAFMEVDITLVCSVIGVVAFIAATVYSQRKWAFEVMDILEATALLPGGSIIVSSCL